MSSYGTEDESLRIWLWRAWLYVVFIGCASIPALGLGVAIALVGGLPLWIAVPFVCMTVSGGASWGFTLGVIVLMCTIPWCPKTPTRWIWVWPLD